MRLNLKKISFFFLIHLGYAVYSYVSSSVGDIGLLINLQSERDYVYLENRVEAFLIKAQVNKYMYILYYMYMFVLYL
jgi:hypothetical protein